jgi:UDP-N-acetylmuramate dehydrogenase
LIEDAPPGCSVRLDEPLAPYVAWRTGGTCDALVTVHEAEALAPALAWLREAGHKQITLLGAGTRTVVRDGGVTGAVVRFGPGLQRVVRDGERLIVGAGAPLAAAVAVAVASGLGGLEALACRPGSLGASLALDPGPEGGWSGLVEEVRYVSRGKVKAGTLEEAREIKAPWFVSATLRLAPADPVSASRAVDKAWSKPLHPRWFAPLSRGSTRTQIERAGLPGVRVRQVLIPEADPEVLVNLGGATARDLALVERTVVERVLRERGVELQPAVLWAGSHSR